MLSIVNLLRRQSAYSAALGSPLTTTLLDGVAADVERKGPCRDLLVSFADQPSGRGMLGFRIAGALHSLVLGGLAPDLAAFYPTAGGVFDESGFWSQALGAMLAHPAVVNAFIQRPPQTNEIGRAGSLLAGFLKLARDTRLPLRCLEAGASAGLLLHWDKYQYRLGGRRWGDPDSPAVIRNRWIGGPNDLPPHEDVVVAERRGCDISPVDVTRDDARLHLRSFIWGDHPDRLARLDAAMALASTTPAAIDRCDAAAWVEAHLAESRPGTATVLYTSFAALYFDEATRLRIDAAVMRAAAQSTADAPLAVMRLEGNGPSKPPQLELYQWPQQRHRVLATADILGRSTTWL